MQTENAIILQNVTKEQLFDAFRGIVREELSQLSPKKDEVKYLSRKEVSKLLHISLPTLGEYTHKGILIGKRIGSRILYAESDIQQSIKNIPNFKYRRHGDGARFGDGCVTGENNETKKGLKL